MTPTEVVVAVTPHDGKTLMECSDCGPVAVTDSRPEPAASAHLAVVHNVFTPYRV